ncbi:hypothetical protein [Archangium lansingense]|uniref:Uncharacterized protein n=1 Tax=Archangium lansingense TaxID=2995310 RepID=A0ABT3ZVH6_9BACT|nr:hypothetical protein [Archangium lansinium]MCY1073069.1 hypothetical protein [Archangium lansinium]
MTSVHIITEDKTGGGLEAIIRAEVQRQRHSAGKTPLQFSKARGTVNGNAQLLEQCRKYELFRFNYAPRIEHVFYVIDARNAWDLPQLEVQAPRVPYEQSLPSFISTIQGSMAVLARGTRTPQEWEKIRSGFHPHVLVWERESLILPVTDQLGMGEPTMDVYAERRAAEAITERFRRVRNRKYAKSIDGPEYLTRIAQDERLRATVLASNASLRAIVDELVSL